MNNNRRVTLMKLHNGDNGPEWRPTRKGLLRFRPMNC